MPGLPFMSAWTTTQASVGREHPLDHELVGAVLVLGDLELSLVGAAT